MYGEGTRATVTSRCGHCGDALRFELTATADGAVSESPVAARLREWDPVVTDADRKEPHMLDGF